MLEFGNLQIDSKCLPNVALSLHVNEIEQTSGYFMLTTRTRHSFPFLIIGLYIALPFYHPDI
jgi:hypothetical protein